MDNQTAVDELRQLLVQPNISDVVQYIIATSGLSGLEKMTTNREILQTVFRRMKEEAKGLEIVLLKDLVFATQPIFPYSEDLEKIFVHCLMGLLTLRMTLYDSDFLIDRKQAQKVLLEAPKMFTAEKIQALNALAEKFQEHLSKEDKSHGT